MSEPGRLSLGDHTENEKRLRDAGVLRGQNVPKAIKGVVDGLTPDELDTIVAVHKRLEEAARVERMGPGPEGLPGYVHFMMPP